MEPHRATDAEALLSVVRTLLAEPRVGDAGPVSLDDALERDLGIYRLARMEPMLRLERLLGLHLDERVIQGAETACNLLKALSAALPTTSCRRRRARRSRRRATASAC